MVVVLPYFLLYNTMTAPKLLQSYMPMVREIERNLDHFGYIKGTPEWYRAFDIELAFYRKFVGEVK